VSDPVWLRGRRGGGGNPWPHRIAVVTAGATAVLILAGGLVTNTGAGLAVPDWPTTFGYNMVLYPWSGMVGGILYEHSHRLIGSAVGLLTLTLALTLWVVEPRRWLRWLGGAALLLVIIQGVLGGLRVVLLQDRLAIIHGALAPAFLGLMASLALFTSREWRRAPSPPDRNGTLPPLGVCVGTTGMIYLQLLSGAFLTHAGSLLTVHLGMAGLVALVVPLVATRIFTLHPDRPGLRRPAGLLLGLLLLQLLLGLGSYVYRFTSVELPVVSSLGLALPVSHRLTGGLLLVTSLVLTLRVYRMRESWKQVEWRGPAAGRVPA
jgi:heme a synthase